MSPVAGIGAVAGLLEHLAADVGPEAVRQVASGVQRHPEQSLVTELPAKPLPVRLGEVVDVLRAGLVQRRRLDPGGQDRPVRDEVGVDPRVRLDVGVRGPEKLPGVLGGDRLDRVDVLATGVETWPTVPSAYLSDSQLPIASSTAGEA